MCANKVDLCDNYDKLCNLWATDACIVYMHKIQVQILSIFQWRANVHCSQQLQVQDHSDYMEIYVHVFHN